jgi:hypothetical protein
VAGFGNTFSLGGAGRATPEPHASIADLAGFRLPKALIGGSEEVGGGGVSGNFFQVLGVGAALGRTFLPEEDAAGAPPVVVASYNFWERRFARDPGLLGRSLTLNGMSVTVIGITPPDFTGTWPMVPDLWIPLDLQCRVAPGNFTPRRSQNRA